MPLGFERLNERTQRPNKNVNFIKPLEGPDKDVAVDFLSRVAAISAPIMRENYLYVMSLEEFEPNREFWGRNFNNGEAIQLVLKSPSTGRWLPFRFVQMVFMHELAHCKQMNHGPAFWKLRNAYSGELRQLWTKSYTGDGLWGRGQSLYTGQYTQDSLPAQDVQDVKSLCGGTFRGVRGKRKRKNQMPQLTYAERKQRRIEKKFGTNGVLLGDDESRRTLLEKGKTVKGKPRVAGSNRGRELRAAALLDRLDKEKNAASKGTDDDNDTDATLDYDDDYDEFGEEALDAQGNHILDSEGHRLVKVCEDENPASDPDAMNELEELGQFSQTKLQMESGYQASSSTATSSMADTEQITGEQTGPASIKVTISRQPHIYAQENIPEEEPNSPDAANVRLEGNAAIENLATTHEQLPGSVLSDCPVCSLSNESHALTCAACGHVLDTKNFPDYWSCSSEICHGSVYLNPGDSGVCGICGSLKSASQQSHS